MTVGYKGFEKGLVCRNKQYKENTIFEEPEAILCETGMHYCTNPLDVLFYYPIINDKASPAEYAEVIDLGTSKEKENDYYQYDSKKCTNKIKIGSIIPFEDYCKLCITDPKFFAINGAGLLNNFTSFYNHSSSIVGGSPLIFSFGIKNIINNNEVYCYMAIFGNKSEVFNQGGACKLRIENHKGQIFNEGAYSEILINGNKNLSKNIGYNNTIRFCGNDNTFLNNGDINTIFLDGNNNTVEIKGKFNKIICSNTNNNIRVFTDEVLIKAPKGTRIQFIDEDLYIEESNEYYTITEGKLREIEVFN